MKRLFFIFITLVIFCKGAAFGRDEGEKKILRVACVAGLIESQNPSEMYSYLFPILNKTAEKMGYELSLKPYENINELVAAVPQEKFDIILLTSIDYLRLHDKFNYTPILKAEKSGVQFFRIQVFVRADSPFKKLEDLKGRALAFAPQLSSESILYLKSRMAAFDNADYTKFFGKVIETKSHRSGLFAVVFREADATIVPDYFARTMVDFYPRIKNELIPIEESAPDFVLWPIIIRRDFPPEETAKIKEIALAWHDDTEGKAILTYLKIDKWVQAKDSDYDKLRVMLKEY